MISTPRLTLRVMRVADAPIITAYRNDPDIAKYQDWDLPYTLERSQERLAEQEHREGVVNGEWTAFAVEREGELIGDVACGLDEHGAVAEVGYTLRTEFQGRGYAREALSALIDHIMATTEVHRFVASLDPENVASMRLLESVGMRWEALTRRSYFMRGRWEDDLRYAMLREDRVAWLARPRTAPASVELVEITPDEAYLWGRLRTHHSQERFVSPMALTFRDALFPEVVNGAPAVPWMRGVLADGERVAFVMLAEATEHLPTPFLWRLLVDRVHQGRGIGRRVVRAIQQHLDGLGHRSLETSWGEGPGSPRGFYEQLGFVPTGGFVDDETEARLSW